MSQKRPAVQEKNVLYCLFFHKANNSKLPNDCMFDVICVSYKESILPPVRLIVLSEPEGVTETGACMHVSGFHQVG